MRLRNVWVTALGLTLAASMVACGGKKDTGAPAESAAPSGGQKVDAATAGVAAQPAMPAMDLATARAGQDLIS